jgi:hypothetical protein
MTTCCAIVYRETRDAATRLEMAEGWKTVS